MNNGVVKLSATETTARQETLYAVGFAIYQNGKRKSFGGGDITKEDMLDIGLFEQSYNNDVIADRTWEQVYDFAEHDKGMWVDSVVSGINKLRKHQYLRTGKFYIFRGKSIMNSVYLEKKRLIDIDESLPKINDDKWNPGDIWFLRKDISKSEIIKQFKTLEEYNFWIRKSLINRSLIGVSLKKSSYPRVFHISKQANIKIYEFGGIKPQESPFNNGITILLKGKHGASNKSIGIRSPKVNDIPNGSKITSELDIKGTISRHGKISLSDVIISYSIPQMSVDDIKKLKPVNKSKKESEEEYEERSKKEKIKKVLELHKLLFNKDFTYGSSTVNEFWRKKLNPSNPDHKIKNFLGYFRSVINSLQVGIYLTSGEGRKHADEIVMRIVRDASSQGYWSSDFLKIM